MEAEGDFARAQDIIREKGKLVVAKRADRTATEGVVVTKIVGQKAYILCLACETDFVAQNAEYSASANAMLEVAVKNDAADRILGEIIDLLGKEKFENQGSTD